MKTFKIIPMSLFVMGLLGANNGGYCASNAKIIKQIEQENPAQPISSINLGPIMVDKNIAKVNVDQGNKKFGAKENEPVDEFLKGPISLPGLDKQVIDTVKLASSLLIKSGQIKTNTATYDTASQIVDTLADKFRKIPALQGNDYKERIVYELLCLAVYDEAKKIVNANKNKGEKLNKQIKEIDNADMPDDNEGNVIRDEQGRIISK